MLTTHLRTILNEDGKWRSTILNLNAAENYTSPSVRRIIGLHASYDHYLFPPANGQIQGPWDYSALPSYEQAAQYIEQLGWDWLDCQRLDSRPKGGQTAEIAVLLGLAASGDQVFYVAEQDGGHFGLNLLAAKTGIGLHRLVFNPETHQLDPVLAVHAMKKVWNTSRQRKLIMISQSYILREPGIKAFVNHVKAEFPEVIISYDVSHVLALIIGKQFINPLLCGIDIIHGSTHKTFPGPQKGIIGFNKKLSSSLIDPILHMVSPGLQSNCGTSEIYALAVAFEEMQNFGQAYAKAICTNAKYLANALSDSGLNIVGRTFEFTDTHQVWLQIGSKQQAWQVFAQLHAAHIRAMPAYLPFTGKWGIRLGVNAITRLGFAEAEIQQTAAWIQQVILQRDSQEVAKKISDLLSAFSAENLKYGFN